MQFFTVAISILLLGVQISPAWTINCYECDGGPGTACYDPFNSNGAGVTKVASTTGWCTKGKGEALGQKSISRDAYTVTPLAPCTKSGCSKIGIPGLADGVQCCCNTELCNSTSRLSSTITMGTILSICALVFKQLL